MTAKREAPSQRGAIRSAMPATWAASKTCSRRERLDGAMPNAIGAFGMFDDQLHDTPAPRLLGPLTAHQPYEQVLVLLVDQLAKRRLVILAQVVIRSEERRVGKEGRYVRS